MTSLTLLDKLCIVLSPVKSMIAINALHQMFRPMAEIVAICCAIGAGLSRCGRLCSLRPPACWCVLQLKPEPAPKGKDGVPFDATLVLGRPGQKAPGILFLHGGPHTAYSAAYLHALAFLASLGYNLVVPNYRCCWFTPFLLAQLGIQLR